MTVLRRCFAWLLAGALVLSAAAAGAYAAPACENPVMADSASASGCTSCGEAGESGARSPDCPIAACTTACVAGPATPAPAPFVAEPLSYAVVPIMAALLEPPARSNRPEPPPPR